MSRATAVIGASFGDEGKGLMTDYFCRQAQEKPIVVRYNGGAQAGHTVVTPEGKRHVFHHYGAGYFAGASTYLSEHFLVNPSVWMNEAWELSDKKIGSGLPGLVAHPEALVTTIYDMFVNQKIEESRSSRHGSCGMGVHETMLRSQHPDSKLVVQDLYFHRELKRKLEFVRSFAYERLLSLNLLTAENKEFFINESIFVQQVLDCESFANSTSDWGYGFLKGLIGRSKIIFEGAQGLLLDQDNKRFFPHVTHSKTGLHNVIEICQKAGIEKLDVCYVARSYLTRHGAGELPGEDPNLKYEDNTNNTNEWQGSLRFAPQDWSLVHDAIRDDYNPNCAKGVDLNHCLVITHVDQCAKMTNSFYDVKISVKYESMGPTFEDVCRRSSISQPTYFERAAK